MIVDPYTLLFPSKKIERKYFKVRCFFYSRNIFWNSLALFILAIAVVITNMFLQTLFFESMISLYVGIIIIPIFLVILFKSNNSAPWISFLTNGLITSILFVNLKYVISRNYQDGIHVMFILAYSFSNIQSIYLRNPSWSLSIISFILNTVLYMFILPSNTLKISLIIYFGNSIITAVSLYASEKGSRLLFFQEYLRAKMNKHFKFLVREITPSINFSLTKNIGKKPEEDIYEVVSTNKLAREKYGLNAYKDVKKFFLSIHIEENEKLDEVVKEIIPKNFSLEESMNSNISYDSLWNFTEFLLNLKAKEHFICPILIQLNSHRFNNFKEKYLVNFTFYYWGEKSYIYVNLADFILEEKVEELMELNNMKDEILANVSHDLRNPLNCMLHFINEVKTEKLPQEKISEYMHFAEIQGKLLLSLISDILDYSLFKNQRLKINTEKFNLKRNIEEVLILFENNARSKNIELTVNYLENSDNDIIINSDPKRLKQVLINFLSNSLKFTLKGWVRLSIRKENNIINFEIEDTGVGISSDQFKNLFKPFSTYDSNGLNKQGIGLGLLISQKIINVLGPRNNLKIKSELEKGTTISFTIFNNLDDFSLKSDQKKKSSIDILQDPSNVIASPINNISSIPNSEINTLNSIRLNSKQKIEFLDLKLYDNVRSSIEEKKNLIKNKFHQKKKNIPILMVDDNEFNLEILRSYIKKLDLENNFIIDEATNGRQAVDKFICRNKSDKPYELILMDCEMPIMNGFEATKEIISLINEHDFKKCKIMAFTAHDEEKINGKNIFQGILRKPVSIETFAHIFLNDILLS